MMEARTADGKLVEGGPATGWNGGIGGDKISNDGGNGLTALGLPADVANERGEFGADASKAGPVSWIVL